MEKLTIGQLAKRVGLRASALRYYEKEGLITADERSEAGYRLYAQHAEKDIRFIQRAQRLGFSLSEIRVLLESWRKNDLEELAFLRTAENRYLELEKQSTQLMVLKHELGLLLRDMYQSKQEDKAAKGAVFTAFELEEFCLNPQKATSHYILDQLLDNQGCKLISKDARELISELRGCHLHIWQTEEGFSVLIVGNDPKIEQNLYKLVNLEEGCEVLSHQGSRPDLMHNGDEHLLNVRGDNAFIYARLFLELESENSENS